MADRRMSSQGATPGARCRGQTPSSRHEPALRQQPLRPPRRPPLGPRDRGRVLRRTAGTAPPAEPVVPSPAGDLHVCPECERDLVYPVEWEEASPDALGGAPALPQLRVERTGRLRPGRPSTASTRSSTAAPSARPRPQAPDARQHGGRDRALRPALDVGPHLADGLLAPRSSCSGRTTRRPPARARRAGRRAASGRSAFASATIASASARATSQRARGGDRVAHRLRLPRACARARRSSARQRRVALAREDQRQRDRAVEQVGAAVLAGALRRARDVEHVVEQLEGQPDPARRTRRARSSGAAALQRAQPARGLEQPRGLEVAALQVALARRRRRSRRRRAAAARPGPAPRSASESTRTCVGAPVGGQLRERAREQQVAGGGRQLAARGGDHGRPAAAQRGARRARRRGRASPSARARPRPPRAARRSASPPPARGERTPAAAAAACRPRRSSRRRARPAPAPCAAATLARAAPRAASSSAGHVRAAGLDDRGDGLGATPLTLTVPRVDAR